MTRNLVRLGCGNVLKLSWRSPTTWRISCVHPLTEEELGVGFYSISNNFVIQIYRHAFPDNHAVLPPPSASITGWADPKYVRLPAGGRPARSNTCRIRRWSVRGTLFPVGSRRHPEDRNRPCRFWSNGGVLILVQIPQRCFHPNHCQNGCCERFCPALDRPERCGPMRHNSARRPSAARCPRVPAKHLLFPGFLQVCWRRLRCRP